MGFKIDFFIVGQPKSGTTALSYFLNQHPEICISNPKEPSYFANDLRSESDAFHKKQLHFNIRTLESYKQIFSDCDDTEIYGEASTNYLLSETAAKRIYRHNPNAKIIIMLREPVAFMKSLHAQYLNETTEDIEDFADALKAEPARKKYKHLPKRTITPSYHFYLKRAHYYSQVKRYYDVFPEENIRVIVNEKFKKNNGKYFRNTLKFLDVKDTDFTPKFNIIHGRKAPKSKTVNRILNNPHIKKGLLSVIGRKNYTTVSKKIAKLVMMPVSESSIDPALSKKLKAELKKDVTKTQALVGTNLTRIWKY